MKLFALIAITCMLFTGTSFKSPPQTNFKFVNESWKAGIWVWYSDGPESDCSQKKGGEKFFLRHKEEKTVSSTNSICWRREAQPDSRGKEIVYSETWSHESGFGGERKVIVR